MAAARGRARGAAGEGGPTIVIRKIEEGGHGHHGGAWKVAYADFVTAMMAFFLLMWLLNATSEEQRRGIADFFSPVHAMGRSTTGSGLPFGGRTPHSQDSLASDAGALRLVRGDAPVRLDIEQEDEERELDGQAPRDGQGQGEVAGPGQPAARARVAAAADADGPAGEDERAETAAAAAAAAAANGGPPARAGGATAGAAGGAAAGADAAALDDAALRAELERRERAALAQAAEELRAAVRDDPALAGLARQLVVEVVPEGLRIQLLDAERTPMFALSSAAPNERARALLQKVAQVAARLPNALSIAGHTDATPFRAAGPDQRSNWELSADRANAVRRLLAEAGVAEGRIRGVTGHAERQPLLPEQPTAAANRRVAITLLREAAAPAPAPAPAAARPAPAAAAPAATATASLGGGAGR